MSVNLLGTFTPVLGNSWTILTTSLGLVDADTLVLDAPVVNNLTFDMIVNSNSIVLEVVEAGLPGDYNDDGWVNAADDTVWRDNLGNSDESALNGNGDGLNGVDTGDYTLWVNNFGTHSGSGSLAGGAVPEPASWLALVLGAAFVALRRRVRRR